MVHLCFFKFKKNSDLNSKRCTFIYSINLFYFFSKSRYKKGAVVKVPNGKKKNFPWILIQGRFFSNFSHIKHQETKRINVFIQEKRTFFSGYALLSRAPILL